MLISKRGLDKFSSYIESINDLNETVNAIIKAINKDKITSVIKLVSENEELTNYIKDRILEKNYYRVGKSSSIDQICSIIGYNCLKNLLYQYVIYSYRPKKWNIYNFTDSRFDEFLSDINFYWLIILKNELPDSEEELMNITIYITLLVIATDILFSKYADDVLIHEKIIGEVDLIMLLDNFLDISTKEFIGGLCKTIAVENLDKNSTILDIIIASISRHRNNEDIASLTASTLLKTMLLYVVNKTTFLRSNIKVLLSPNPYEIKPHYKKFIEIVKSSNINE